MLEILEKKCMKNMVLMKKKGKKRLIQARRQKPFEDLRQKMTKKT